MEFPGIDSGPYGEGHFGLGLMTENPDKPLFSTL